MKKIYSLGKWLEIHEVEDEPVLPYFIHEEPEGRSFLINLFNHGVLWDWGKFVESGRDGDIRVTHRIWGIRGIRWLRWTRPTKQYKVESDWWKEQQAFFQRKQKRIAQGKEKDPLMMSDAERHQATTDVVAKMKWSDGFVASMRTPIVLRALENGGRAIDPFSGEEFVLSPAQMKALEGKTRADFIKAQREGRPLPLPEEDGIQPWQMHS
jgi:hypothetical protein